MESFTLPERFCSHCAKSLVPLDVPHLSRDCAKCGRRAHYVRYEPDGSGIRVEKGEQFTIPAGFIKLSLEPGSRGRLFRPGISFLLNQFFLGARPKGAEEILSFAEEVSSEADDILKKSKLLDGLDLSDENDVKVALDKLKQHSGSREWHATNMGSFCECVRHAVEAKDAERAAWAGYMLGTSRGLTIVTEPLFEQTLWRGYLANEVVYEAAAAASRTPGESEAIRTLAPLFARLDELTLHAWVDSKLPIGPRIGVTNLPEEILAALAKWHLASFQRDRERADRESVEKRAIWEMRLKWLTFGLAVPSALFAVLKFLGVA